MDRRRLLYYILVNIFVSACVVGTILFFYDRAYRGNSTAAPASVPTAQLAAPTQAIQTDIPIEIVSVTGVGSLNAEAVLIRYNGSEHLNLTGWRLTDKQGNEYTFPTFTFYEGGAAIQVNSTSGNDSVVNLYWGRSQPVWEMGDVASLFDAQGNLRAIYSIP